MIKSELINRVADRLNHLSEKDVLCSTNIILDHMAEELTGGGRIEIRGFGSFCLHYRPPRNAHNPKTGEKVITDAKYSPHFKPGKELRELVDASRQMYKHIHDDQSRGGFEVEEEEEESRDPFA